jgi:long-subunit fatty acid transport protein
MQEYCLRFKGGVLKKESVLLVCFVMILSTTFAKSAFGGAMDSSSIGVKSWMMASAVTGLADDSSAVHWNPAGLVFHEDQEKSWHAQTYAIVFVDAKMKFESKYGIKDESDTDTILPGFFISKKYDKWAFGFGNYLPYASGGATYVIFKGLHLM